MNYMDFDPYLIRERNQQVLTEVNELRLEERLRDNGGSSSSRFSSLTHRDLVPLLRRVRLVG